MPGDWECGKCGRRFRSLESFDSHQDRDYKRPHGEQIVCRDPATLGLVQDPGGTWCTPAGLAARLSSSRRLAAARSAGRQS